METKLDPSGKFYVKNGNKLPRLTSILQAVGIVDYSKLPSHVRDFAMDRGSKAHKATELYDLGNLDEASLDSRLVLYLDGWKLFLKENRVKITAIEKIAAHPDNLYCCRVDRIGLVNGVMSVIEIKTGALQPWTALQTMGQAEALRNEFGDLQRVGVELSGKGMYKMEIFKDRTDKMVFMSAVSVFHWVQNNRRSK